MLEIIAVGLTNCLEHAINRYKQDKIENLENRQFFLSEKGEMILFRLLIRSFTDEKYNKVALDDWSVLFDLFFVYLGLVKSPKMNQMIEECLQYISGSFSMNTAPQRRRIAFEMMKGLVEHSEKVKERAKTKASFFNTDTNGKTRTVICEAMGKMLILQPDDEQIRKFILDYFNDQDFAVRQKALYILLSIPNQKHLEPIFNSIQSEQHQISNLILENLQSFVQKFSQFIKVNKRYKAILANLINLTLKSNEIDKISKVFSLLDKVYTLVYADNRQEEGFLDVFVLDDLDFQREQIFKALLNLYNEIVKKKSSKDVEKIIQFYVQKNLKSTKNRQNFCKNINNLKLYLSVFTYESEEENNIYINFLTKMIEQSKWTQIQFLLEQLKKVSISESNFEKLSTSLIKLVLHSPYFLVEEICKAILFLMLTKRKHLQFFLSIKQKLTTSRNWIHRRNYIVLYAELKAGSSYEFHKIIPILNYRLIAKEKCNGVKLEFLKYALKIYQSIDPATQSQKIVLKEMVKEISNEKDEDLSEVAKETLKEINESDLNFILLEKIAERNSAFLMQEERMRQRQALMLKKTKTERQLGRKDSKSKTITVQSRTSLRLPKDFSKDIVKKEISIVNVQKLKRPSTVTGNVRNVGKSQEQKKSTMDNTGPTIARMMSGQMKAGTKIMALRRQSGFKK